MATTLIGTSPCSTIMELLPIQPVTQDQSSTNGDQVPEPPLTHIFCWKILEEAVKLARCSTKNTKQNERLHILLNDYFQAGSPRAHRFRSIICFDNASVAVSMEDFNKYVVMPYSDFELEMGLPIQHPAIQFQSIQDPAVLRHNILDHACAKIKFVLDNFNHPRKEEINSYCCGRSPPSSWLTAILGLEGKSKRLTTDVPSLLELHSRIECSVQYSFEAKDERMSREPFFSCSSGKAWRRSIPPPQDVLDHDKLELLAMANFPSYLNNLLQEKGNYIDELAGATVPYYVPEVAARFASLIEASPDRRVEGIALKRSSTSKPDDTGGTVVAIHQYLSPAFLAYFTTDQDSCAYMDDVRSKHKKDRKIRVSSVDHVNSKPIWVQFGEKSDPYLYLSQKASAGEELWLKIVNYLMGLLEGFVNSYVESAVQKQKGVPLPPKASRDKVYKAPRYATTVAACGDPLVSLFGKHTDSRPGLYSDDIPQYSRENLIVPTGCIQNHCQSITTITWHSNEEPSFEAGSVTQEQNLIHMQLKTVQVYWKHAGSTMAGVTIAPHQFYNPGLTDIGQAQGETNTEDYIYMPDTDLDKTDLAGQDSPVSSSEQIQETGNESRQSSVEEYDYDNPLAVATTTNRLKRMTLSARATSGLQSAGMKYIQGEVSEGRMKKPKVYGLPLHYQVTNVWGSTVAYHHTIFGTRPAADPSMDVGPLCYSQIFKAPDTSRIKKRVVLHHCDLSKYRHVVRTSDKKIWPKTNPKIVVSVQSAAIMLTSKPIIDLLTHEGMLPLIKHPRPSRKGEEPTFMDIPFGPGLNAVTHQPLLPGQCLSASTAYSRYGMKLLSGHNEAWKAVPCAASGLFLRLPEKNGLQMDEPKRERLSPVYEMERIHSGESRLGFMVKRSGGNCTLKGQAPPAEAARTAGEGAFFEHAQSIKNAHNFAMEILIEQGTPVTVWGAGDLVPQKFQDKTLAQETDNAEQVFYFGCYLIERAPSEPAKSEDQILEVIEEYKVEYPNLSFLNLRFMLKMHQGYRLLPVEYPPIDGGYHYLPVDVRDNRRPMFQVPEKMSFEKALGAGSGTTFNETSMLTAWFKDGGVYEYRNKLFVPKIGGKRKISKCHEEEETEACAITESAFRLIAPQEGKKEEASTALAEFDKKSQTLLGQWSVVRNCAIGSFARLLELNVDRIGKIGPLQDINPAYHHGDSSLDNYRRIFNTNQGNNRVQQRYMRALRPASVQKSPTTHGIRSYDAGKLLLMLANGGCNQRSDRKGLGYVSSNMTKVLDMVLQSLLVEVVRVPIMMEWSEVKNQRDNTTGISLPGIGDIDHFLDFLTDVMTVNKFQTTRNLLQTQYEIHTGFSSTIAFTRVLKFLRDELGAWLTRVVAGVKQRKEKGRVDTPVDVFDVCRSSLGTLLSDPEALGSWNEEKMGFLSQHVLMNVNELIADWPFGVPEKVIPGFGGMFGAKRLVRGVNGETSVAKVLELQLKAVSDKRLVRGVNGKTSVAKVLELQLKAVSETYSESDLKMMGLERLEGSSVVVVAVNQRPMCMVDTEHFGCLDMISSERETGGSRGSGNRYEVTSPHCHPVPNADCFSGSKAIAAVAIAAIEEHKSRVDKEGGGDLKDD